MSERRPTRRLPGIPTPEERKAGPPILFARRSAGRLTRSGSGFELEVGTATGVGYGGFRRWMRRRSRRLECGG